MRTHEDHGRALTHHEREVHVAHLAAAKREDCRVVGRALDAAVPRHVVVGPVVVVLAVRPVVLLVVGYQVVQRESIVRDHKVDSVPRLPARTRGS